ncbi:MAG TPA: lysylphosphatidylglycerol synthase transmembrane domain-containing protein, partial [Chthoniobacterales bacterium]
MRKNQKWLLALQLLVTGGLLAWIFSQREFRNQIGEVLLNEDPSWLLAGFLLAGASNLLGAVRWWIFLITLEIRIRFGHALRIYFLGLFFSTFLIGMVGGDAARALILIGQGHRRSSAFLSVVLDRISGLVVLVLSSVVLMLTHYDWLAGSRVVERMMHVILLYFGALTVLLILSFVSVRMKLPDRIPDWVSFKWRIQEFCRGYYLFVSRWKNALLACGVSLGVTLLY